MNVHYLLIQAFNKHSLRTYYVLCTVLCPEDSKINGLTLS